MNKCKTCKKEIDNNIKYCDNTCYHSRPKPKKICKICGIEFNPSHKKIECCSKTCGYKSKDQEKIKNKRKNTLLERYGVEHQSQLPDFIKKVKNTKLNRYGDENYVNKELAKKTLLKKYGSKNAFQFGSNEMREIIMTKYGVENISTLNSTKEKVKKTMIEKYGHPYHEDFIKNTKKLLLKNKIGFNSKKFKTYLKNNNVKNSSQIKYIRLKKQKINTEKMYASLFYSDRLQNMVTPLFGMYDYIGSKNHKNYKFKCKHCNTEFEDTMCSNKIPRCLNCFPLISGKSIAEDQIIDYIKSIIPNEIIIKNDRKILNGLEIDIFLPEKKIAIEYNGLHWHSEIFGKKDKNYHLNKTKLCESKNIYLIHIFEDEWIYKNDIIKNKIKNILNADKIIDSNDCIIKKITALEKKIFLNKHHLLGNDKSYIKFGAFYNNELISVITFKKNKGDSYKLIRFASSMNISKIILKFIKYFTKNNKIISIYCYSDKCWTTELYENIYTESGFKKIYDSNPYYWYINSQYRMHRFNFRKDRLKNKLKIYDENLSEWENMQLNGYDRIWDCGNFKYEWTA